MANSRVRWEPLRQVFAPTVGLENSQPQLELVHLELAAIAVPESIRRQLELLPQMFAPIVGLVNTGPVQEPRQRHLASIAVPESVRRQAALLPQMFAPIVGLANICWQIFDWHGSHGI